jgi:tyrosinase
MPVHALRAGTQHLRYRLNADSLTAGQVGALRSAVSKMQAIKDDRGFQYWAGIHGLPLPISCQHGTILFLPWHRAYLYLFEQYLLDQDPAASLPWWDWSAQRGLPRPYAPATVRSGGAKNSLASGPITGIPNGQFKPTGVPRKARTYRRPKPASNLPSAGQVQQLLKLDDFQDFSSQLENQFHGPVHMWVGGTMGMIPLAAFDPVFWAHHAMVDRIWYLWQLAHPGAGPHHSLLNTALPPFPLTVADTLDTTALGYAYAGEVSTTHP